MSLEVTLDNIPIPSFVFLGACSPGHHVATEANV